MHTSLKFSMSSLNVLEIKEKGVLSYIFRKFSSKWIVK